MKKIQFFLLIATVLILTGCNGQSTDQVTGIFKSSDSGKSWETKNKALEEKTISGINILSLAVSRQNSSLLYAGTLESGIFKTENGGDVWQQIEFPPVKVYGLLVDPTNDNNIYASGVWNRRGKIYSSQNGGAEWEEIYTEPIDNTVVISMAFSPTNSQEIFAGISNGLIIKTTNRGETWKNVYTSEKPIVSLLSQSGSPVIYASLNKEEVVKSEDNGVSWQEVEFQRTDLEEDVRTIRNASPRNITALALDPSNADWLYVATDKGLLVSRDRGTTWSSVSILSSEEIPINAIAISPVSPSEIIYVSSQAIYRSENSGSNWSTFQFSSPKRIRNIYFNPNNPTEIYAIFSEGAQKSPMFSL